MSYIVTSYGVAENGRPCPAAIDTPNSGTCWTLDDALARARELVEHGEPNVAIQDGNGNSISGDDLIAVCCGKKKLTAGLRVIDR